MCEPILAGSNGQEAYAWWVRAHSVVLYFTAQQGADWFEITHVFWNGTQPARICAKTCSSVHTLEAGKHSVRITFLELSLDDSNSSR